jgi:hypothetical protein
VTDNPEFDKLWAESIENHIAAMSDVDFADLVKRKRPLYNAQSDLSDPAARQRAVMASIREKQQRSAARGPADANGYRPGQHLREQTNARSPINPKQQPER